MANGTTYLNPETIYNADIAPLAAIARDKMAQRTNARIQVPLTAMRVWDAMSRPLPGDGNLEAGEVEISIPWIATTVDKVEFVAGRAYKVVRIVARVEVAGTDGGAVTAIVKKAASATAIGSGTALHSSTINLKGSAATNQVLTLAADVDIPSGTCIGIDFTGTMTTAAGTVTITLAPAASPDDLQLTLGAFGTLPTYIGTGDVKAAGATTKYARVLLQVPLDFEANQTLTLRATAGMKTTIADGSATIDFECWRNDVDGTLGAGEMVTTSAQSINSVTAATKDFIIDPATLVAGDVLDVRVTIAVTDTATVTAVIGALWSLELLADLR